MSRFVPAHLVCGLALTAGTMLAAAGPCTVAVCAQAAHATAAPSTRMLYIDVLEGEGELNDIRARTAREPVVQVKDENHRPVAGALVLFAIQPGTGAQPVASFSGLSTLTVRTGPDGIARAQGYKLAHAGNVQLSVTATVDGASATVTIHQTNYVSGGHLARMLSTHKALVGAVSELAAFAVAATVTVVQAESTQTPATITAGPPSVNASRTVGAAK